MMVLEKKRLNHGKDLMHRYATDGHVCKDKRMVRSSSCSIKWPIYVVIWLTHNYRRFEIVLTQVTSMSLLNIIKDRILRSQTNSALSRSWIVWWGVNIFLDFTPFFCHKHALLGFFRHDMVRRHGEGFNWRTEPIDQMVLYTSGGGKSHGQWDKASMLVNCLSNGCAKYCNVYCSYSMLNGLIDSREVRSHKAA
jgi:hypothetical protein